MSVPCPRCGKVWINGTCDDTPSRRGLCYRARPVMCDDGITPCPEPENFGCTHVKRKLCRDG